MVEAILEMFGAISVQTDELFEKFKDASVQIYELKEKLATFEDTNNKRFQEMCKNVSDF